MRIRAAAYALITRGKGDEREVLLPHWSEDGMHGWTLPGGGIEPGEHPVDAAVREVYEETGYAVSLTGLLAVDSAVIAHSLRRDAMQALRILYRAEITGGELRVEQDGTTDDVAWHRLTDVADLRRVHAVDWALSYLDAPVGELR